jgi:hypothetical protein
MILDLWYIVPAGCISLSISIACCLFCTIPQKNKNNYINHDSPIFTNERTILLEDNVSPPPYKERENTNTHTNTHTNIVLLM